MAVGVTTLRRDEYRHSARKSLDVKLSQRSPSKTPPEYLSEYEIIVYYI